MQNEQAFSLSEFNTVAPATTDVAWWSWGVLLAGLAIVIGTLLQVSAPLAGVVFAIAFLAIAFSKPEIALAMALAATPYPWNVSPGGINIAMGELGILLAALVTLLKGRPLRGGPLMWPVAAYLLVCLVATLITWRGANSLVSMMQMTVYMFLAVIAFSSLIDEGRRLIPAIYIFLIAALPLAVATIISPGGFIAGLHKNNVGALLSVATVTATEMYFQSRGHRHQRWATLLLLLIGGGLLMSLSRGGWMGAFAGVAVIISMRKQWRELTHLLCIGIPLIIVLWSLLPAQQQDYALGFELERSSNAARIHNATHAWDMFLDKPVTGVGVGFRKEHDATNIILSTLAETGVAGVIAFVSIHLVFIRLVFRTRRFVHPRDPVYSLLALGAALLASRFAHGLVDHYWSRGALAVAWAAAGMATLAYFSVYRRAAWTPTSATPSSEGFA